MPAAPEAVHGQLVGGARLRGGEHELAAHVLALIVRLGGAGADVHQLGRGLAAGAVLGEHDGARLPGGDPLAVHPGVPLLALLPQLGEVGVPRRPRALGAVEDRAVGRQLEDLHLGETVLLRRSRTRSAAARNPREPRMRWNSVRS